MAFSDIYVNIIKIYSTIFRPLTPCIYKKNYVFFAVESAVKV